MEAPCWTRWITGNGWKTQRGTAAPIPSGGHIGYAIRPHERRKGYAAEMLRLALAYAKNIGLESVMLGCYCDNTASKKTIEKCGGILTETKPYMDGTMMDVYWIELSA